MNLKQVLRAKGELTETVTEDHISDLIPRMSELIRIGGSLPVSTDLRDFSSVTLTRPNFRIEELPELLCKDIVVPIRFLALMNSAQYSRGRAVDSLEVVGSQLGITKVSERFSELGELGPLNDSFRGRSLALTAYQNALLRAQIAQRLYVSQKPEERFPSSLPYVISLMIELPIVLLAYLKPNIYAACRLDALASDSLSIERPFKRVFPDGVVGTFHSIASEIGLPKRLCDFVEMSELAPWNRRSWLVAKDERNTKILTAVYCSGRIQAQLMAGVGKIGFQQFLKSLEGRGDLDRTILEKSLEGNTSNFIESVENIGLSPLRLPLHLDSYEDQIVEEGGEIDTSPPVWPSLSKRLDPFLFELKTCLKADFDKSEFMRYPQALVCTVLALLRGMNFDRCVVFTVQQGAEGRVLHLRWLSESAIRT